MSLYYPEGSVLLRVMWEDFSVKNEPLLQETHDIKIICRNINVNRNDYSEADTVKLVIDHDAFPFDPRCVRSMAITVFMQDKKGLYDGKGKPIQMQPNDFSDENEEANKVFIGFADESSITFDTTSKTISIDGRDYTALFIDKKRFITSPLSLSKPVDEIIQDLINEQISTKEIKVENRTGEILPTLAKLAPDLNTTTAVRNANKKETYWDIIIDILARVGLLGFIEIDKFIISKPQNIYEKKNIKQFIWGKNIRELSFSRKFGRAKDFNVKVISFNSLEKRVEQALIPEEAIDPSIKAARVTIPEVLDASKKSKKKKEPEDADFITFSVKDVTNKDQLIKIGESIFQEMSRQQIEGQLSTYEMQIPEEAGNEITSKIIKFSEIKNGTAIKIFFSDEELGALSSKSSKDDKANYLSNRGYPQEVAEAFATSLHRINTAFYVKSVNFELDQDQGFTMNVQFLNFIDVDSNFL